MGQGAEPWGEGSCCGGSVTPGRAWGAARPPGCTSPPAAGAWKVSAARGRVRPSVHPSVEARVRGWQRAPPPEPRSWAVAGNGVRAAPQCSRAAGPRAAGGRSQPAAPLPRGCPVALSLFFPPCLPFFPLFPFLGLLLPPRPARSGDSVLDGDTDPCQSQLGEINTLRLKGLRSRR